MESTVYFNRPRRRGEPDCLAVIRRAREARYRMSLWLSAIVLYCVELCENLYYLFYESTRALEAIDSSTLSSLSLIPRYSSENAV